MARKELGDLAGAKSDEEQARRLGKSGLTGFFTYDPVTGESKPQ
jgi:hypothetical protein